MALEDHRAEDDHILDIESAMTIQATADQLYAHWRELRNLPPIFGHLVSVVELGENRSHWVAKGPLRAVVEWAAEIYEDQPNERIAWRSLPGSSVMSSGAVTFHRASGDGSSLKGVV